MNLGLLGIFIFMPLQIGGDFHAVAARFLAAPSAGAVPAIVIKIKYACRVLALLDQTNIIMTE